jgi:hypothetical protein
MKTISKNALIVLTVVNADICQAVGLDRGRIVKGIVNARMVAFRSIVAATFCLDAPATIVKLRR